LKVAVYTIAKNEAKHVKRWFESAKGADYFLICDTGSDDDTVKIAKELGINVVECRVDPFRFDVARNYSLASLPLDIDWCIALDMDEMLVGDWRSELEKALADDVDRAYYRFITDFNEDGTPKHEFDGFRIHRRKNVVWSHPIHEVPRTYGKKEVTKKYNIEVWHKPDNSKIRSYYLPMLESAAEENPEPRNLYYLAREYYYKENFEKALEVFKRYVEISKFPAEKGFALRLMAKCDPDNAEEYLTQGTEVYQSREAVLALANFYYEQKRWKECNYSSKVAFGITEKTTGFMSESWAWGHMAADLVAVSAWQLENWEEANKFGKIALKINPEDERLQQNLQFYRSKIDGNI
jgi:tetratricopeptide (TPR) repeat protein